MDMIFLPQHWISFLAIAIMIGSIIIGYIKKWMMTYTLIIANIIVFALTFYLQYFSQNEIIGGILINGKIIDGGGFAGLGFRPIYLSIEYLPNIYTLFTSMFIHGGFLHIAGNMFVFFFMGIAFEQRVGAKKFLIIYLIAGVCGALTQSVIDLGSNTTLIGASGAIFGILGAFAYLYPRDEVVMPVPIGIMFIMRIKVIYAAIIFAVVETITTFVTFGVQDTTAHFAHLGGIIGGVVLAALLVGKKRTENPVTGKSIYYDSFAEQKPINWNFSNLRSLAANNNQEELLTRIEKETVPQVRDLWLEHFIDKTTCPKCGKPLHHLDRNIWCESCDFKTNY